MLGHAEDFLPSASEAVALFKEVHLAWCTFQEKLLMVYLLTKGLKCVFHG